VASTTSQGTAANTVSGSKTTNSPLPQANGQQAAGNGAPVQVEFANGQNIARVPTAPGETITLPFDGDFQAKLGDQGNLAIKLGDRIVILQNYVETNQEAGVTIKDDKGHVIDVASVLASTDPNLDIQTAAGPAAGPAGGTGSGIFLSFNGGNGLGGLNELGTIGETELQYRTISPDENTLVRGDALVSLTVPVLGAAGTEVDEAGLPDGSNPKSHSNVTNGAITVSAPDGVASVTINGVVVTLSQLNHLSTDPVTIKTADGDLTLTGWNGSQLSYTYTLTHNTSGEHTSDSVSIVVTDSDGDQGSGTLVIGIHDDAPQAVHDDLTIAPADFTGHQGNVITAAGEDSAADADVKGADGATVTSIRADGASDQSVSSEGTTTVIGEYGTLVIAADGSYTYTRNEGTPGGVDDKFDYTLTDGDGTTSSTTLTIHIGNDHPVANNDDLTIAAGDFKGHQGNVITAAGEDNVSGADHKGADGTELTHIKGAHGDSNVSSSGVTIVEGDYGILAIAADGSYTYTRNPGTAGGVDDVFTYTLTDLDGDTSTATLTVHIGDATPTVTIGNCGGDTVHEAGLPHGSASWSLSNYTAGSFSYTQGDGPSAITINGEAISAGTQIHGQDGTLTVLSVKNGVVTYVYELTHSTQGDSTHDDFNVVVTDKDGDQASGNLSIHIVDDTPTARNDVDYVAAGSHSAETGNVITGAGTATWIFGADTKGADGASITHVTGYAGSSKDVAASGDTVVNGHYGVLTIHADGSYSYQRNDGTPGGVDDVFTYTLTDGDGDSSTASLTIKIQDAHPDVHVPTEGGSDAKVSEAGLANGSSHGDHSNITAGNITYSQGDGPATVTIDGVAVTGVGQTITGQYGTLTITSVSNGVIGYSYTLTGNTSGDHTHDSFSVVVTDVDGDKSSANLKIDIVDDAPKAISDTGEVHAGTYTAHGNVVTNDTQGADGAHVSKVTGSGGSDSTFDYQGHLVVAGTYGTLTIDANGNYTYVRSTGTPGGVADTFSYTLKDGDGDTSTTTLTINIDDAKPTLDLSHCGGASVHEAGLANGTHAGDHSNVTSGTFTYTDGDGSSTVSINGQAIHVGDTITTSTGSLHIDSIGNGSVGYTYTLTHNTSGDNTSDSFNVVVKDLDGDTASGTLTVGIVDDAPVAVNASVTVDEDAIVSGHQGSPGIEGGPGDLPGVVGNTAHIDLSGIKFGADGGQVSFDTSAQPGTLTSDGHTVQYRTETETVDGHSVQALIGYITYYSADNNSTTQVDIFKLTVDPTTHSADFTLLQPLDHPVKGTEDTLDLGLKYTVTDGDGDKATGTITVHVNDDSPTAGTVSSPTVSEPASSGSSTSYSYEVDAGNYHGNAHINVTAGFVDGNGNLLTIGGDTPTINTNPAADGSTGLGVSSNTDGSGSARFDEINYLGNGSQHYYSEAMIVSLSDSHQVATSATVHLSEFYADEGGVGDEKGAYILYKDGVAVSGWVEFEASSTNGSMTLNITGPAGGFDEIRFIAVQGSANPNGNSGSDSSDYSVHDVTFNGVTDGTTSHVNSVTGGLPVAFGADGPGSVVLADGPTGLTYNGVAIVNTLVNGIMVGKAGDTVVYTLTLSSDGHGNYSYEFDLAHQIDGTQSGHPLGFHYTVTDNDGDTATGTINVNVTDAAPVTPTALQSDIILTNSLDGSIHVSDFALLRNDTGSNLTVTGVSNADGTVSHDGTTGVTYQFSGGANDFTGSGKMDESKGNSDNWSDNPYSPTVISRGNFAQSSTLNTGTLQMTGALNSNSDVDAFKIYLQAGEVLYGSLFGTGNHGANVDVKIYDSTGHLVAESGYQTASHGWGYYNVPADGDYYIVVDGQTGNGNNSSGGQGTYELDLNILSQASTDGSFHYQAGGGDATVTVDGVSGGSHYGNDQHQVIGTNANEILVGDSHQHNYLNGGGGDDTIMYQVGDTVDGGGHSHNSDLGGSYLGDVLDVSELSGAVNLHSAISDGHIKNIDTISMVGGSSQSVELNINDVLQVGNGTFHPTSNDIGGLQSKDAVKVEGSTGDSLTLDSTGNGHWVNITDHLNNVPAGHQVFAYDNNGGTFNANDVQGYVIVGNNVTVHDEHNQVIPHL